MRVLADAENSLAMRVLKGRGFKPRRGRIK
jgi:hypothetical protein